VFTGVVDSPPGPLARALRVGHTFMALGPERLLGDNISSSVEVYLVSAERYYFDLVDLLDLLIGIVGHFVY
jgi:hypothetical protein